MNPGELKLELLCRGIKISSIDTGRTRDILRTRGGLGSGIEIILPDDLWVNAPVHEKFVRSTPYALKEENRKLFIYRENERIARAGLPARPAFYSQKTADGTDMTKIGVMQGGYLAFYLGPLCGYWKKKLNCRFCSSGLNINRTESERKTVEQVIEVCDAAFGEGIAEFVHINTGFIDDESRGIKTIEPFVKAIKENFDTLVGIQTNPPSADSWIEHAYSAGVDSVSFNFEVFDRKKFREICPGKASLVGRDRFFSAMERAADIFPNGAVAGEIIAGLESVGSTIKAIDAITAAGAVPIVCVFRPLEGTALENHPVPSPAELASVFAHVYRKCRENKIRMNFVGHVPLVIMPAEGAYFSGGSGFSFSGWLSGTKFGSRMARRYCERRRKKYF